MLKTFQSFSKKKKLLIVTSIVLILSLIGGVLYIAFKPDKGVEIAVVQVKRGDITKTFETEAIVESGSQGNFEVFDGIAVNEVFVKVGDAVKAGDILATFDASSLKKVLDEKKSNYSTAQKLYNDYTAASSGAVLLLPEVNERVKALEAEIEVLEKKAGNAPASPGGNTDDKTAAVNAALKKVLGNTALGDAIADRIIASGSSTSELLTAVQDLLGGAGDISSITGLIPSNDESELISKELELVKLKVEQASLESKANGTLTGTYRTIVNSAKEAYDEVNEKMILLSGGWTAQGDGFVREVNILPGQTIRSNQAKISTDFDLSTILSSVSSGSFDIASVVTSLLGSTQKGIVVEYYPLVASFSLSKYDIGNITVDQKVTVTSLSGKTFDGNVTFVSSVASSSSVVDIGSILGSSASSSSIEAKIEIPNPDSSVVIGMEVDVSADLETKKNAVLVPVESIQYNKTDGYFVFKYNEDKKTAEKTLIEVGLFDGNSYDVLSGLKEGDTIVRAPSTTMADGDRVKVIE